MSRPSPSAPRERAPGLAAVTLCEAFHIVSTRFPDQPALRVTGSTDIITWASYAERVRRIAGGLARLGAGHGATVALLLTNRPEFNLVDMAAMHLGAIPFSIYNTSAPEQIEYLLDNAGSRILITERRYADTIASVRAPGVEHIVVVEDGLPAADLPEFDALWRSIEPNDVATLVYTSGTTGQPKGVQLSHRNIVAAVNGLNSMVSLRTGGRYVSYLPSAHLGDRLMVYYSALVTGSSITTMDTPGLVMAALTDARPTGFMAVPRIWEKIKAALEANGVLDPASLSDEQKSALRAGPGIDQLDYGLSGGAPIAPEVLEYFVALGIPIIEGWGMSETAGIGTLNPEHDVRVGTVGKAVDGVELSLAGDGELLVRGPVVMSGYRDDPQRTSEAIDPDGWLHTGDIAAIDADGYIRLIDRKKELIINSGGKNMSPANIEQKVKAANPLIGQACVIGDRQPYNVALIVLDPDVSAAYAAAHTIADSTLRALSVHPAVLSEVAAGVEAANSRLSRVEQIKRFAVLGVDWPADGDELTPTMKLKRRAIAEKYSREIDALYD